MPGIRKFFCFIGNSQPDIVYRLPKEAKHEIRIPQFDIRNLYVSISKYSIPHGLYAACPRRAEVCGGICCEGAGRVVLFSVQGASVPANLLTLPERVFEEEQNRWLLQVRTDVRNLLADPMFDGIEVEPVIVAGEPAPEIAKAVRHYNIDLVTVVTHGRKGLSRALWGSTAEEIIAEAPCPVLTIRPPQHDFVEHKGDRSAVRLNRVLLATNFRPSSAAATQVATQLATSQARSCTRFMLSATISNKSP